MKTINLDKDKKKHVIQIPENLWKNNIVIEIVGAGKQIFKSYYSTDLKVNIMETYGELKVCDQNGKPLPKVYVKVFSKKNNGEEKFFKDGYTDIRGKFEHAQTNSKKINDIEKFAILIVSDDHGKKGSNIK
jgi:hypothetical protein